MSYMFIKHKVKDYSAWKTAFDEFIDTRRASGEKGFQIMHPEDDSNNLHLLFEWDNLDNARAFMANPILKETMEKAGVVEPPHVSFFEEHDRGTI